MGWFTDESYSTSFDFDFKIDSETEIYAKFVKCHPVVITSCSPVF